MMPLLWRDALDDIASARTHYGEAVSLFEQPDFAPDGRPNYLHRMAFLHAMQSGYTSFEAALKRVLILLGEPLPTGSDWHSVLVRRVGNDIEGSRPAIVSAELTDAAFDLMRFRHVAMHSYDRFDLEKAAIAVRHAKTFLALVDRDIARFRAIIDPPEI